MHMTYLLDVYYESNTVSVVGESALNTGDQAPSLHFTECAKEPREYLREECNRHRGRN